MANAINYLILLALTLIWGSSFILIKKSLIGLDWMQVALLRVSISFITVIPFGLYYIRKIPLKKIHFVAAVGILGSGVPPFLFAYAQTGLESGLTGILNALTPLFTLITGVMFFSMPHNNTKILGVFIGLGGAIKLTLAGAGNGFSGNAWFAFMVMIATLCYALSTNLVKAYLQEVNPLALAVIALFFIGPPCIITLAWMRFDQLLIADPLAMHSFYFVLILAVLGTVAGSALFYILIQRTDPLFGSVVTYTIPIVALIWGFIDGEELLKAHLFAMLLILTGVYMSSRKTSPF